MSSAFLMLDTKHKRKVQEMLCLVLSTKNEVLFLVLDTKNVDEEDTKNKVLCRDFFSLKYLTNKRTPAKINIYYSIYTKNIF